MPGQGQHTAVATLSPSFFLKAVTPPELQIFHKCSPLQEAEAMHPGEDAKCLRMAEPPPKSLGGVGGETEAWSRE